VSKKEFKNIFHAMSWDIFSIIVCHVDIFNDVANILSCHIIFHDVAKYVLTSHGIFCHITSMVCYDMNNDLLNLNMGLAKKVVESSIV
jgi:hypothetical protein